MITYLLERKDLNAFQCYQLYFIYILGTICDTYNFVLNTEVLDRLRQEGLPNEIITKLMNNGSKKFKNKKNLISYIKKVIGIKAYENTILKHAAIDNKDRDIKEIEGIDYILTCKDYIKRKESYIMHSNNALKIKNLEEIKCIFFLYDENIPCPHLTFLDYWYGIIGISLLKFLEVKNNYKKIKLCPVCNKFFIAKDTKREFCYSKACEQKYKKEYQRDYMRGKRDKNSPNFDSNYII
ncbi:MAG: hypothetical protein HQK76_19280 [Desulfobacterales bacterium]|nr:hypothetical protein [Desulfobacterales bacterium]